MEENIKNNIYEAALKLFSKQGFDGTSIRQIADEASTTIPMIYYYYKSKEGLFESVINEGVQKIKNAIVISDDNELYIEKLRKAIYRFLSFCRENRELTALLLGTWFGPSTIDVHIPSVVQVYVDLMEAFKNILDKGIAQGQFREHNTHELSQNILGMLTNYLARMFIGNEEIDPVHSTENVMDVLKYGILKKGER
ncbi:transcriptional regulator, TetR family [Caldanaerobius fijiensis DSM 17918]|uniref:Transcriptional regulator, TetR family n=1 Tax=Caldanaerobius fijiensis DSM 17918 TaxID=1121256 RepID=A0A1M5CWH1_9THEO|nr:TetR/AcrR family transcriptional regulator [Caldanaerobius fijiensis]SHF59019.1 transcriptional regulator, TetR family [Caldanaerobius fijiensis DSM 17918]